MRFMILLKPNPTTESGALPDEKLLAAMGRYNEELVKAGVLTAGEGLHPTSRGARVRFSGEQRTVVEGPFKDNGLLAGFWIFRVKSREEAIEWVKRCPNPTPGGENEIEIRQIVEAEDFAPSDPSGELRKKEEELRATLEQKR